MYSLKNNLVNEVTGHRIQYRKPESGRSGWEGTISAVNTARATVHYDNGNIQEYRLDAVDWPSMNISPRLLEELRKNRSVDSGYAYLFGVADSEKVHYPHPGRDSPFAGEPAQRDPRKFLVAGAKGGDPRFHSTIEAAEEDATALAQRSKSGQAVRVYRCVTEFQRQEPPVERREVAG
jgi:hypothetical protein